MTTMMNCRFEAVFSPVSDGQSRGGILIQNRDCGAFEAILSGRKTKQDKGLASPATGPSDFCPQCGQFWGRGAGVKPEKKNPSGVPAPCRAQKHSAFSGVRTPERSKDE